MPPASNLTQRVKSGYSQAVRDKLANNSKIMYKIKPSLRNYIPPILCRYYEKYKRKNADTHRYGFFGNYSSWDEAYKGCTGYDSDIILEKTKNALLKVKRGESVYERDSVLFDKIHYSWPLLVGLLKAASENNNRLSVLDLGGSLGSSYFQNREMLSGLGSLKWSIVEQPHYVACGKKYFQSNELVFYDSMSSCFLQERPDLLLASSVLQYLEKPHVILSQIIESGVKWIIIDRTSFLLDDKKDLLTVQIVHPDIYNASYPAWFFNRKIFLQFFEGKYDLISEFNALAGKILIYNAYEVAIDKGFILRILGYS